MDRALTDAPTQPRRRWDPAAFAEDHGERLFVLALWGEVLVGAVPAAIATADVALGVDSWFGSAAAVYLCYATVILAAGLIPFAAALVERAWVWACLVVALAEGAVILGVVAGLIAARLAYPGPWATRPTDGYVPATVPNLIFGAVIAGFVVASFPAAVSATAGTLLSKARRDAWDEPGWNWFALVAGSALLAGEIGGAILLATR